MRYFDDVKIGDEVFDFAHGWGKVIMSSEVGIGVVFSDNKKVFNYDYNGVLFDAKNQTLFWDEIKFNFPKQKGIVLEKGEILIDVFMNDVVDLEIYEDDSEMINIATTNGFTRNDELVATNALESIKKYTRLLNLRDQECEDSCDYYHDDNTEDYYIFYDYDKQKYDYKYDFKNNNFMNIMFKTEDDAKEICDILNKKKFIL